MVCNLKVGFTNTLNAILFLSSVPWFTKNGVAPVTADLRTAITTKSIDVKRQEPHF